MRLFRLPSLLLLLYHALSASPTMASVVEGREEVGFKLVVRQVDITVDHDQGSLATTIQNAAGSAVDSSSPPPTVLDSTLPLPSIAPTPPVTATLASQPSPAAGSSTSVSQDPIVEQTSVPSTSNSLLPTSSDDDARPTTQILEASLSSVTSDSTTATQSASDIETTASNEEKGLTSTTPEVETTVVTFSATAAARGRPRTSVRTTTVFNGLSQATFTSASAPSPSLSNSLPSAAPSAVASSPAASSTSTSHKKHISVSAVLGSILAIIFTSVFALFGWRLWAAKKARERARKDEEEIGRIKRELTELGGGVTGRGSFASLKTSSEEGGGVDPFYTHPDHTTLLIAPPLPPPPPAALSLNHPLPPLPAPPLRIITDLDRNISTRTTATTATTGSAYTISEQQRFSLLNAAPVPVPAPAPVSPSVYRLEDVYGGLEVRNGSDGFEEVQENPFADPRV